MSTALLVADSGVSLPRTPVDPEVNSAPVPGVTFTALTGQSLHYARLSVSPGDDVEAASALGTGLSCVRALPAVPDGRNANAAISDVYVVAVSDKSNPQGGAVGASAFTFSGITFSSSSGLLGTCSGGVLPGTGSAVRVTGGTLPTGLTAGVTYYLIRVSDSTCRFATTYANAVAGTAIAYADAGSGTRVMTERLSETALAAMTRFEFSDDVRIIEYDAQTRSSALYLDLFLKGFRHA